MLWIKLLTGLQARQDGTIQIGFQERTYAVAASLSDIRRLLKVKALPKSSNLRCVFIAAGTGYIGTSLIPILIERGHRVRVQARRAQKQSCLRNAKSSRGMP